MKVMQLQVTFFMLAMFHVCCTMFVSATPCIVLAVPFVVLTAPCVMLAAQPVCCVGCTLCCLGSNVCWASHSMCQVGSSVHYVGHTCFCFSCKVGHVSDCITHHSLYHLINHKNCFKFFSVLGGWMNPLFKLFHKYS